MELEIRVGPAGPAPAIFPGQGDARISLVNFPAIAIEASAWGSLPLNVGTSVFTGVPLISNLTVSLRNPQGTFDEAGSSLPNPVGPGVVSSGIRGTFPLITSGRLSLLGLGLSLPIGLSLAGPGGDATPLATGSPSVRVHATGGPFITGALSMTNVTTPWIELPDRPGAPTGAAISLRPEHLEAIRTLNPNGQPISSSSTASGSVGFLHRVGIAGSNHLATSGLISFVAPLRVSTVGLGVGDFPATARLTMQFAPEPASLCLLLPGIAALVLLGRRRQ